MGFDWCCGTSSNETMDPNDICWQIPSRWVLFAASRWWETFPTAFHTSGYRFLPPKNILNPFFRIFVSNFLCAVPFSRQISFFSNFLFVLSFIYNQFILLSLVLVQQNVRTNGSLCNSRHVPDVPSWFVHKVVIYGHSAMWRTVNRDTQKNSFRDIELSKQGDCRGSATKPGKNTTSRFLSCLLFERLKLTRRQQRLLEVDFLLISRFAALRNLQTAPQSWNTIRNFVVYQQNAERALSQQVLGHSRVHVAEH